MRNKHLLLVFSLFLLGSCRTLGSWYNMSPPPVHKIDMSKMDEHPFMAERIHYNNMTFDMIIINPHRINLKILNSPDPGGLSFSKLKYIIKPEKLLFAVNGGMYQEDRKPLGYLSFKGIELHPLNRSDGYGNFYLKPNGVFYVHDSKVHISETEAFALTLSEDDFIPQLATQSGPLLLQQGQIHRAFNKGSSNKYVRNGVGIIKREQTDLVAFVISDRPINFYDFAIFFRDFLHCEEALYLDGHISAMNLPSLNRNQAGRSFGTVIYATE